MLQHWEWERCIYRLCEPCADDHKAHQLDDKYLNRAERKLSLFIVMCSVIFVRGISRPLIDFVSLGQLWWWTRYSRRNVVPAAIQLPHQIDWLLLMMTFPLFVTRRSGNGRSDEHDCLQNKSIVDVSFRFTVEKKGKPCFLHPSIGWWMDALATRVSKKCYCCSLVCLFLDG